MRQLFLLLFLFLSCSINQPITPVRASTIQASHTQIERQAPEWLIKANHYSRPNALPTALTVESLFGPLTLTEPLLIEIINHPVMERLKEIDQHGPATHFGNWPSFTRYEHCIGVFALLHMHHRPLVEQVAGLLHDASHTAFSHTADWLFKTGNEHAYQDSIHTWYLQKMGVDKLLARYNLTIEQINPDRPEFIALEQKNPALCADRIHYTFHAGLTNGLITQQELHEMTRSLHFENGCWFFSNHEHARKLADISLYYTEHRLAPAANLVWHHWLCSALRQAAKLNLINEEEIHFGTDLGILAKLNASTDSHISEMLETACNPLPHYHKVADCKDADLIDYPKLRAIDPLVKLDGEEFGIPLTIRDQEYRKNMDDLRQRLGAGIMVKFIKKTDIIEAPVAVTA